MADLLGWPLDTVQARLHRARHRLAQALTASTDPLGAGGAPA
jgi:DNA-directed RNA polymerase specialized sigma24 family protein